jgi:hypothetical protein
MGHETLWSTVAGALIGIVYASASLTMNRRARTVGPKRFMAIVLGGMALRIFAALSLVALVLVLTPVRDDVFLGAFLVSFICGLVAEIVVLHRNAGNGLSSVDDDA